MFERFVFPTEIEREGTRQLIIVNFPSAKLWYMQDETDFVMDMELDVEKVVFFRWAIQPMGAGVPVLFYCLHMSLETYDPPAWMSNEIRIINQKLLE
jgi:hypothetical protein